MRISEIGVAALSNAGVLEEVMDEVLNLTLRQIGGNVRTIISLSKNAPQYGDTVSLSQVLAVTAISDDVVNDNYDLDEAEAG